MDKSKIITLYDQDQRIATTYPEMRRDVLPHLIRWVNTAGTGEGFIGYSQLNGATADAAIEEQVAYFKRIGQSFEWKVYDYDQPSDLKERLETHGFQIEELEAIMVLDLAYVPEQLLKPVTHDVRRITDPAKLVDVQTVEELVWGGDFAWATDFLGEVLKNSPDRMSVYVAFVDDRPASAAWTYFPQNSQFASLWGGSTISVYRKRGLYTALLAVRVQEAKAREIDYLTVDASAMSEPILHKHGFETIAQSWPCKWEFVPEAKDEAKDGAEDET